MTDYYEREERLSGVPSFDLHGLYVGQTALGKPKPTSINLLDEVKSIQEQRAAEYEQDDGERSFAKIATIYNTLRGSDLKPSDIALILSILKDVRLYSQDGLHRDSVIDKISYASLWGELIMGERGDVQR